MSKKLSYFNIPGVAEHIRYILHHTGQEYEEVQYDIKNWPTKEIKERLPYGQFPILEENGRVINQSLAIARYVAANTELLPTDPWDQAVLDAAALSVSDFWSKVLVFLMNQDPATKKTIMEEHVPYFLSRFEKQLKANKGYFGGKLSWADFVLVGLVETSNSILSEKIEKDFPSIIALIQRVRSSPGVKKYLATRKY